MSQIVDPSLYDKEYYLSNNVGFKEFIDGLHKAPVNYKFQDVLDCCNFQSAKKVLDIGCGRGDLAFYAAQAGATAIGIDYSKDAITIANEFRDRCAPEIRNRMTFLNIDACDLKMDNEFDYIFFIEVWEHMYDQQIDLLLTKVYNLLNKSGQFIITTPNGFYEGYLYPAKHILAIPFNFIKFPMRILKGKWKPKSIADFFRHIVKLKPFSDTFMDKTHINISTPVKIKSMLEKNGFTVDVKCWDHSKNPLSLLFAKWAGREMRIIATKCT